MFTCVSSEENDDIKSDSSSDFGVRRKALQRFERDIDGMEIATRFDRYLLRGLIQSQVQSEDEKEPDQVSEQFDATER